MGPPSTFTVDPLKTYHRDMFVQSHNVKLSVVSHRANTTTVVIPCMIRSSSSFVFLQLVFLTCHVRNLNRPSRHRGRKALIGCRVLRPSGSVPIAGPSTSSPKHTSNNKCAWRLSSPCGYLPAARRLRVRSSVVGWLKPTNQLGSVLIPSLSVTCFE